jgi:hypothetical protein
MHDPVNVKFENFVTKNYTDVAFSEPNFKRNKNWYMFMCVRACALVMCSLAGVMT